MLDISSNDTIFDKFLYIIHIAIEQGNPTILQQAIKEYNGKIGSTYINMAQSIYEKLIIEKIEAITI